MHLILVVDDETENCRPLVRLLAFAGFEATCECCGDDGMRSIHARPPHVVLLDVMMPGRDGFDVLREIRSFPQHDAVAVIMYTAAPAAEGRERALRLGAQGYIAKGTPFAELHAEVRRHLPA